MSWPEYVAYNEQESGRWREPAPFVIRTTSSPLSVYVEPSVAWPTNAMAVYFAFAERHAEQLNLAFLAIDETGVRDGELDVWVVQRDHEGSNGQYGISRTAATGLEGRGTRYNIRRDARGLADANGLSLDGALNAHLRYEAAFACGADLFVTLQEPRYGFRTDDRMFVCRPGDAMAILGLFQRLHGNLVLPGSDTPWGGVRWSDLHAARVLLDSVENARLWQGVDPDSGPRVGELLQAVCERYARGRRARDHVLAHHIASGRFIPFEAAEEALERIAISIVGSLDSLARAVRLALDLDIPLRHCSFDNRRFLGGLPSSVRSAVAPSRVTDLLDLAKPLRNTIHHVSLGPGGLSTPEQRTLEALASVPETERATVLSALEPFPELADVIGSNDPGSQLHVRIEPLAEGLMAIACRVIDALARSVPWPGNPRGMTAGWRLTGDERENLLHLYGVQDWSTSTPAGARSSADD